VSQQQYKSETAN
jgi:hypothetical protein